MHRGYQMANGQWADLEAYSSPSTTATANGNSSAMEYGSRRVGRAVLTVTAGSGNVATLDVLIEVSPTGATGTWYTAVAFTQVTSAASFPYTESKLCALDRFTRCSWTVDSTLLLSAIVANGGAGVLAGSGTPADTERTASYRVNITGAGDVGVATFSWSRDGGTTWEEEDVVTSDAYVLGTTGITLNFPDVGMTTAHYWTFTATGAPSFTFSAAGEAV